MVSSLINLSDEQLVEALRLGDEKAFAEIFRRHWKKIYHIAYQKIGSEILAEELVHELFLTLWEKRCTIAINNLVPYLVTAIKHRVISQIRTQVVHKKYWDYYKTIFRETDDVTDKQVEYNELLNVLENGVSELPEKSRQVFQLNRIQGRSISEIAAALNVSEKAIEYHLTRSLKYLRVHLKDFILPSILLLLRSVF